jgi:hypothetical protein
MFYSQKTIANLFEDLKKDRYQWGRLDQLYRLFIQKNNLLAAEELRESRFESLLNIYPFASELVTLEMYKQKEYFESSERVNLETLLARIKTSLELTSQNYSIEAIACSINYQLLIDGFLYHLKDLINEVQSDPICIDTIRLNLFSAVKELRKASEQLEHLKIDWFTNDYNKHIEALSHFLKQQIKK